MTDWAAFAGIATAVTLLLLALARVTSVVGGFPTRADVEWLDSLPDGSGPLAVADERSTQATTTEQIPAVLLFLNVVFTHGLLVCVLVGAAIYAAVPAPAFGISLSWRLLAVGLGFGLVLAIANTGVSRLAEVLGHAPDPQVRGLFVPETRRGWVILLGGTLPLVALAEELLFRGALIGVFAAGLDASPWALAVGSSIAFGLAHDTQGNVGILVTGTLGFVLAAGYIFTESLLVVVVAHYLVNAVELVGGEL